MKQLFFDLETTGVEPEKNGIHQLSGIIVIDGDKKEEFDIRIRPAEGLVIEDAALEVSGVTREQIASYQSEKEALKQFIGILSRYVDRFNTKDKFFLTGYNNASFDNKFLRAFFTRNNDKYFGSWFWSNSIDVMVLATQYLSERRADMVNFKLGTVADFMGVKVEGEALHNAMYDIYLTREIYNIVTRR